MNVSCNEVKQAIYDDVRDSLTPKRFEHTINVALESKKLAEEYGVDIESAEIAALIHDRFRDVDNQYLNRFIEKYKLDSNLKNNNILAHGPVASKYLQDKYGIFDDDIITTVEYHTTGRAGMSLLEKIIFIADAIEDGRTYPNVDKIRNETKRGIDYGVIASLKGTIEHLKSTDSFIEHNTIDALNYLETQLKGDQY